MGVAHVIDPDSMWFNNRIPTVWSQIDDAGAGGPLAAMELNSSGNAGDHVPNSKRK